MKKRWLIFGIVISVVGLVPLGLMQAKLPVFLADASREYLALAGAIMLTVSALAILGVGMARRKITDALPFVVLMLAGLAIQSHSGWAVLAIAVVVAAALVTERLGKKPVAAEAESTDD